MKRIFALAALLAVGSLSNVFAQSEETDDNFSYNWVGLQGGANMTFSNVDKCKLISPMGGFQLGRYFIPGIGARLSVQGGKARAGHYDFAGNSDHIFKYNYISTNADLLLNITQLVNPSQSRVFNFAIVGGVGFSNAWDMADMKKTLAAVNMTPTWKNGHTCVVDTRVGAIFDFKLPKNWGLNLEIDGNAYGDKWNGLDNNRMDWQLTGMIGVNYRWTCKHKQKPEIVEEPVEVAPVEQWATRIDTTWYNDTEYDVVTRDRDIKKEVFFNLGSDSVYADFDAQLDAVAEFLKGVKDGEISIVGYSDKETGSAKFNMALSEKRAKAVKKALVARGVDASTIKSVEWMGDTEQPYAENDKNRMCIIKGHGVYTDKDPRTVKKFRTKEVRYRVK